MSKLNVKQRLSGTKCLQVGPNDARRFLQVKDIKPLSHLKFDARDRLRNNAKVVDARDKLNKFKRKPTEKELPAHKKIKSLMPPPIESASRTSLKNGALLRTVKSSSKVQTNLKGGTLTRTLKGDSRQKSPIRSKSSSLYSSNRMRVLPSYTRAESVSTDSRKRKREPTIRVWNMPLETRSSFPQAMDSIYDDYDSTFPKPSRPMQSRSNAMPIHTSRSCNYEKPLALLSDDYYSTPRSIDRSYRPAYDIIRQEESIQFREYLQQQELQRSLKLQEDMLELEVRRRSSIMDLQLSEKRYYEDQMPRRQSPVRGYSFGYEVIVSNLIPIIHESEIESCFLQFGNVLGIDFIDKTTARIKYENESDAKVAALYLDNKEVPVIFGTSYIGTKYSKQRISVRLPPKAFPSQPSRTYINHTKPAMKSFMSNDRTQSFRSLASYTSPRSTIARPKPLLSKPYPTRHVQPDIAATHSALFNNGGMQMGSSKNFLVRRM